MKTELQRLLEEIDALRQHVRDTGEVRYFAIRHQAEMLAESAGDAPAAAPAPALTDAMIDAANAEADTHIDAGTDAERRVIVAAIMRAGLGIVEA